MIKNIQLTTRRVVTMAAAMLLAVAGTVGGLAASASAGTTHPPSLLEIVKPNKTIVLMLVNGLPLKHDVVCHSSTNKLGAPYDTLTCYQFNK